MLQSQSVYNNENALIICIIKYKFVYEFILEKKNICSNILLYKFAFSCNTNLKTSKKHINPR